MSKNFIRSFVATWTTILTLLTATPLVIHAQSEIAYERGASRAEDILPPSPEAASAVKYAGVPFNHSLGAAEYVVPIYELKGRQLSIPINLRYRSNGIKVDEIAGVAGLGWNLEAGGCITREVVYMPDEFNNWYFYTRPDGSLLEDLEDMEWTYPVQNFLARTLHHSQDSSADRYSYNVAGLSGTFIITPDRNIVQLSGDGVQIELYQSTYNGPILGFIIIGPDGTRYSFMEREVTTRQNQKEINVTTETGQEIDWSATTAWYLTNIKSADLSEEATYTYLSGGVWNRNVESLVRTIDNYCSSNGGHDYSRPSTTQSSFVNTSSSCQTKVLSGISLGGISICFEYVQVTSETEHRCGDRPHLKNYPRRLTGVTISDNNSSELVRYEISTARDSNDGRILLERVEQYHGNELSDRWAFTYKTLEHKIFRYSQDWFGFYNKEDLDDTVFLLPWQGGGTNSMGGYTWYTGPGEVIGVNPGSESTGNPDDDRPRHTLGPFVIYKSGGIRSVYLQYGYPAAAEADYLSLVEADHDGAKTCYEYEGADSGYYEHGHQISVGVRVRRITVKDGDRPLQFRSYEYDNPVTNGHNTPLECDFVSLQTTTLSPSIQNPLLGGGAQWHYTLYESPISPGFDITRSQVIYRTVSELIHGNATDTLGVRTIYHYNTANSIHYGITVSNRFPSSVYSLYTNPYYPGITGFPEATILGAYRQDGECLPALLTKKESYLLSDTGHEELYQTEEYEYQDMGTEWVLVDYRAERPLVSALQPGAISEDKTFHYPVYVITNRGSVPSSITKVGYHPSGNDTTIVNYTYVSRPNFETPIRPEQISIPGSDAKRTVYYTYPDPMDDAPGWADALTSRHSIISPVLETYRLAEGETTMDETIKEYTYSTFQTTGGITHLQPSMIREMRNGLESWREEILSRDDYGNVTSLKERGKPKMFVSWGYDGMYPVSITQGEGTTTLTSTFTWHPGIGLASQTTPQGISTYYYYDSAGRLSRVEDADHNAIEQYEYNLLNDGSNRRSICHKTYHGFGNDLSFCKDVVWFNTLGMKTQEIAIAAAPGPESLVYSYEGDFLLHDDVYSWLPVPVTVLGGSYEPQAQELSASYHQDTTAYYYKGYELSGREKVSETHLPGYSLHRNTDSDDICANYPRYVWENGVVVVEGTYPSSEVLKSISTDADGQKKYSLTDRFGRILGAGYGNNNTTSTRIYDRAGRLRAVMGGGINITDTLNMWRYDYDSLGRLSSKAIPGSIREFYTYDSEDRVVSMSKGNEYHEYEYDVLGRKTAEYLTVGNGARIKVESYWYDVRPEATSMLIDAFTPSLSDAVTECGLTGLETFSKKKIFNENGEVDGEAQTALVYDNKGNVIRRAIHITGSNAANTSEEYRYNFSGNMKKYAFTKWNGTMRDKITVNISYDSRERPVREISALYLSDVLIKKDTTDYSYDALGRLSIKTSSSGGYQVTTTDTYTLQGLLRKRVNKVGTRNMFQETLYYNNPSQSGITPSYCGRITQRNEVYSDPAYALSTTNRRIRNYYYNYDDAGRLSQMNNECYIYNSRSNLQSVVLTRTGAIPVPRVINTYSGNQLINMSVLGQNYQFAYDERGRMTTDGYSGNTICYNHMDLPSKVSQGDAVLVKYSYLSDGTKMSAMDASGAGLKYYGPMVYRRAANGTTSFESVAFNAGRITPDGVRYHVTDHLGNVRAVVNADNKTLVESSYYAPYGDRSTGYFTSDTNVGRYHFTGKEDQTTDFNIPYTDFGARHYHPSIRCWMVPDPMSEQFYDWSPYAYCSGDPLNRVDVDGRIWHIVGGAVVGAVINGGVALHQGATGPEFWGAVAGGAIGGAVTAATVGITLAAGGGALAASAGGVMLSEAIGGLTGGVAESVTEQMISTGSVDFKAVAVNGSSGALLGGVFGAAKIGINASSKNVIGKIQLHYSSSKAKSAIKNEVRKEFKAFGKPLGPTGKKALSKEVSSRISNLVETESALVDIGADVSEYGTSAVIDFGKTTLNEWLNEEVF